MSVRLALSTVLVLGVAAAVTADQPALEVRLQPERLGVEDVAQLSVTVYGSGLRIEPPSLTELDNLRLVAGPSSENLFSWVNGVATSAQRVVYILQPLGVGPAAVGPISVEVGDLRLTSERLVAEVVGGSLAPPRRNLRAPASAFSPAGDVVRRQAPREAEIVLRQLVDVSHAVLGQPVVARVVLESTISGVEGFEWITGPSYPGWWAQPVELPQPSPVEVVESEGQRLYRYTVACNILVPLQTGDLVLPATRARIAIRARGLFDRPQVVERASDEFAVTVRERPRPPAGFSGAVGELRYRARLEPDEIVFGESAVVAVELEGRGNLHLVEAPAAWPMCEGCESFPPEEESRITMDGSGIHGSRTWRITVVPRRWGELSLEPVLLAVFDPLVGHYRHHSLGPLTLRVAAPPPAPRRSSEAAVETGHGVVGPPSPGSRPAMPDQAAAPWRWVLPALILGLLGGGLTTWLVTWHRARALPKTTAEQNPADRARQLQATLESWWAGLGDDARSDELRAEMERLRRDLQTVRFAPGRADHSHTVSELADRLRSLLRRA